METPGRYARGKSKIAILFLLSGSASVPVWAQNAPASRNAQIDANRLARDVFHNEIEAQTSDQSLWSYRQLEENQGTTKLFAVCQTKDGEIDRLLAVNGRELSPKQRHDEDQRIQRVLNQPEEMRKEQKKQQEDFRRMQNLMRMFPDAFRFQYAGTQGSLIKLKFTPNPNFHASGRPAQVFHHMEGSLLVDRQQQRLAEIRGRLTSKVQFLGGLLGHLDEGGTFLVQQQDVGSGHWELTSMDIQMNGKILFFKTITLRETETFSNFWQVPDKLTLQQAFRFLQGDPSVLTRVITR